MVPIQKALREAGLWSAVALAAIFSFHYFEEVYDALGERWPLNAANVAAPADVTGSVKPPRGEDTPAPRLVIDAASWTPVVALKEPPAPKTVMLEANAYGHFHVEAEINGRRTELMTDTGATYVALTYDTAINLGFSPAALKFSGRSNTANGIARVASVTLQAVRVGDIEIRNVAAVVAEQGKMSQNLLGMSFIAKLARFELRGPRLMLIQ